VTLSTREPKPLGEGSGADEVVGVEATVEGGAGGFGSGTLERRREVFENRPGLNRPAAA